MGRSLKSQIVHACSASFYGDAKEGIKGGYGVSKHSDKKSGQKAGKIYSYNTYNNRQDVAKSFADFMKENHPEVKRAADLNEKYAAEFIAKKSNEVNTNTLNYLRSELRGIAESINHTYKSCNVNLDTPALTGNSNKNVKTVSMIKEDYIKLVNSYGTEFDTGAVGVQVIYASGLRSHEVCKLKGSDIKVSDGKAIVHVESGKGGRSRDIEISDPERVSILETISNHFGESPVCDIKSSSLEVNISRHLKQIDTNQNYKYNICHSIRKEYAQDSYDQLKNQGKSSSEAWGIVCQNLGHSADRQALFNTYISKP